MARRAAIALLGALALGSCADDPSKGYSFGTTTGADARTIRVDVFENYTLTKDVEVELTEAIIKEIQRSTRLRVVRDGQGDTQLSGVVRVLDFRRVARDSLTGLTDEMSVKISVDFDFKDARSGAVLVSRRGFSGVDTFVSGHGTGESVDVGRRAAEQRLAKDIVGEMGVGW